MERSSKVLFIMGKGRSGSTLLDAALGEVDGYFSAGEINNLWRRGLVKGYKCGCTRPVPECPVWSAVLSAMPDAPDPRRVVAWQKEVVRSRNGNRLLRMTFEDAAGWLPLEKYLHVLGPLYRAILETTETRVVIDSSKRAVHGALLHLIPGISPYFVHLVRDPRAVGFSRRRRRSQGDQEMRRDSAAFSALTWARENALSEGVRRRHSPDRSLLVRYEDFVARPQATLARILRMVGEGPGDLSFVEGQLLRLNVNHSAAGNPSRFRTGTVAVRPDDEWRTGQRASDRLITTGLTMPFLRRYGYPIRTRSAG